MSKMCSHSGVVETVTCGPGKREPVKTRKIKCPECGRKVKLRAKPCSCGFEYACWVTYSIPEHKVKGWWKKPSLKKHKEPTGIRK